jgi:hypothetical protein
MYITTYKKIGLRYPWTTLYRQFKMSQNSSVSHTLVVKVIRSHKNELKITFLVFVVLSFFFHTKLTQWKIPFMSRAPPFLFDIRWYNRWIHQRCCQSKMVFCYQNCSDLLWEKNVLVIEKNFWNSRLKAENLKILRSLERFIQRSEQFLVTECFFNLFLRSKKLEQS